MKFHALFYAMPVNASVQYKYEVGTVFHKLAVNESAISNEFTQLIKDALKNRSVTDVLSGVYLPNTEISNIQCRISEWSILC